MHLSSFLAAKNITDHVLLCARRLDTKERAWTTAQLICPLSVQHLSRAMKVAHIQLYACMHLLSHHRLSLTNH